MSKRNKSRRTKSVRNKFILFYMFWALLYLFISLQPGYNFRELEASHFFEGLNFIEGIILVMFKFFLNFPLSFFIWFSTDLLNYTYIFLIPNAALVSYIFSRIFHADMKRVSEILTWILFVMMILMVFYVAYSFIFGD